jgi:spermidine synthase
MINALVTLAMLEVVLHIPVRLELTGANLIELTGIYLAPLLSFFLTGLLLSAVFAREAQQIPLLYGADLAGGALACLALVPVLNELGGPGAVLFVSLVMALAGTVWAWTRPSRNLALAIAAGIFLLTAANRVWNFVDVVYAKGIRVGSASRVEFAKWNALSRVEVDAKPDGSKAVVIDADASTAIVNIDPFHWQGVWQRDLMKAPPSVANILRPRGDYAIIGPGGGVDVLRAVANSSPGITGIEINPIIANTIMRGRYEAYSFGLYKLPQVHIVVGDGRSFVRSAHAQYDVIEMTLVDTWASTAAGAFALSEGYLYTTEAMEQYFDHLKDDGFVAITRWEFKQPREALRVVSVALEALHRLGVAGLSQNFIVVSDGPLDEDGRAVTVLAKKTSFAASEEQQVTAHLRANPNLNLIYMPSVPGNSAFSRLIASEDPARFAASYPYNVAPVSDDAPFFFFTLKPGALLRSALFYGSGHGRGIDWKVGLGVVILDAVLLISLVAVLALLVLPLILGGRHRLVPLGRLLYFVAIGLGYILVEITFVQRLVLYLGHPTYAITVVIFLLLASSGAGSLTSRRWPARAPTVHFVLGAIAAALLVYTFVLPPSLTSTVGLGFAIKLVISSVILIPLGFAMGVPFPTGLRALAGAAPDTRDHAGSRQESPSNSSDSAVEWAWALNAAASVLGSVLAMFVAVNLGLTFTLGCGLAAYLAAWVLGGIWLRAA